MHIGTGICEITGLILAGGRGSRMGGIDKGLQNFNGSPLAFHAMTRLAPQVSSVMINANRNLDAYAGYGVHVWPDSLTDFAGPLAGFLAGLEHCDTKCLLTVPCDVPRFPVDLAKRLLNALQAEGADIAMACGLEDGKLRTQPVFCLMKAELKESLLRFTQAGGRKIDAWTALHRCVEVPFDLPTDDPLAFANVNTLDELRSLESKA